MTHEQTIKAILDFYKDVPRDEFESIKQTITDCPYDTSDPDSLDVLLNRITHVRKMMAWRRYAVPKMVECLAKAEAALK